ncbi:MAG: YgiT-type zinc finger protein [Candidatus Aenigmarchaeota archaeon]|nr:YgiT-type zinc finger protein [Candidatus Aenigmarchaeota archaeon]
MKNNICIKCGSKNLKENEKEFTFTFPNPGTVVVKQLCEECQDCGETYLDEHQAIDLARKVDNSKKKLD